MALVGERHCCDAMLSCNPSATPGGVPTFPSLKEGEAVRKFSSVIERCADTGLLVGYVPGFSGAHSQAATLEALQVNLKEVIAMLLEDGEPAMESVVRQRGSHLQFRDMGGRHRYSVRLPGTSA